MKNHTIWRRKPPHFCAIRSSGISIRKRKNSVSQPYSMPPFDSITMWNKIRSLREDAARLPPKARASNQPSQQKAKRNGKGSWIKKSDDDPTNQHKHQYFAHTVLSRHPGTPVSHSRRSWGCVCGGQTWHKGWWERPSSSTSSLPSAASECASFVAGCVCVLVLS